MAVGPGVAEAGDDFVGIDGLHDQRGIVLRYPLMPYRAAPGGFVPVIAPEKMSPGR
jgi:hypothetical protein